MSTPPCLPDNWELSCDNCGHVADHTAHEELIECWACSIAWCGDCVDAHGYFCWHFGEDREL